MVPTGRGLPAFASVVGVGLVLSSTVAARSPVHQCEIFAAMTVVKRCCNKRVEDISRKVDRA